MRLIAALTLLMGTACATDKRHADATLIGRWNSTPPGVEDSRKDECFFDRTGTFDCMSTFWTCQSCQGESILYSGTWRIDGGRLYRRITEGREAGSTAVDEILDLNSDAVTFVDGTRWLRE